MDWLASLHGLVSFPGSSLHMGEPKNEATNQALDSFIVLGKYITYSLWYWSMIAQMRASVCFSFPCWISLPWIFSSFTCTSKKTYVATCSYYTRAYTTHIGKVGMYILLIDNCITFRCTLMKLQVQLYYNSTVCLYTTAIEREFTYICTNNEILFSSLIMHDR